MNQIYLSTTDDKLVPGRYYNPIGFNGEFLFGDAFKPELNLQKKLWEKTEKLF